MGEDETDAASIRATLDMSQTAHEAETQFLRDAHAGRCIADGVCDRELLAMFVRHKRYYARVYTIYCKAVGVLKCVPVFFKDILCEEIPKLSVNRKDYVDDVFDLVTTTTDSNMIDFVTFSYMPSLFCFFLVSAVNAEFVCFMRRVHEWCAQHNSMTLFHLLARCVCVSPLFIRYVHESLDFSCYVHGSFTDSTDLQEIAEVCVRKLVENARDCPECVRSILSISRDSFTESFLLLCSHTPRLVWLVDYYVVHDVDLSCALAVLAKNQETVTAAILEQRPGNCCVLPDMCLGEIVDTLSVTLFDSFDARLFEGTEISRTYGLSLLQHKGMPAACVREEDIRQTIQHTGIRRFTLETLRDIHEDTQQVFANMLGLLIATFVNVAQTPLNRVNEFIHNPSVFVESEYGFSTVINSIPEAMNKTTKCVEYAYHVAMRHINYGAYSTERDEELNIVNRLIQSDLEKRRDFYVEGSLGEMGKRDKERAHIMFKDTAGIGEIVSRIRSCMASRCDCVKKVEYLRHITDTTQTLCRKHGIEWSADAFVPIFTALTALANPHELFTNYLYIIEFVKHGPIASMNNERGFMDMLNTVDYIFKNNSVYYSDYVGVERYKCDLVFCGDNNTQAVAMIAALSNKKAQDVYEQSIFKFMFHRSSTFPSVSMTIRRMCTPAEIASTTKQYDKHVLYFADDAAKTGNVFKRLKKALQKKAHIVYAKDTRTKRPTTMFGKPKPNFHEIDFACGAHMQFVSLCKSLDLFDKLVK